jgi:hypothetical protein
MRSSFAILVASALLAAPAGAVVTGTAIPTTFGGTANALATQTAATQFGDATTPGQGGSELDQLFATCDAAGLHIGITGNIEQNGNALVLFLDTNAATGSNVLNATNASYKISNANGLTFDPGFTPDYAFAVNTFGGTTYVDYANIVDPTQSGFLGSTDVAGAELLANGGNIAIAMNNSNVLGVDGSSAANAATATTGLEMLLNQSAFGITGDSRLLAYVVSGGGDYLSNQFLPGVPAGTGNLGAPGSLNLNQYGVSYVTVKCGNAIPEPGTMALLGAGLLPLLGLRRRRA